MIHEKYYDRVIRPEDLKYITREHISESFINVTSSDMYAEVADFNDHVVSMRHERRKFWVDYWAVLILDIVIVSGMSIALFTNSTTLDTSSYPKWMMPLYEFTGSILPPLILTFLIFAVYFFLVWIKRIFRWWIPLIFGALIFPAHGVIAIAVMLTNPVMMHFLDQREKRQRDDIAYPKFTALSISCMYEHENEYNGIMDDADVTKTGFNKYKKFADDDDDYSLPDL